jgi:hypothetical protein
MMARPFSIGAIVRHLDGRSGAVVLGPHRAPVGARWVWFDGANTNNAVLIDKAQLRLISKRELAKRRAGHVD